MALRDYKHARDELWVMIQKEPKKWKEHTETVIKKYPKLTADEKKTLKIMGELMHAANMKK